MSKTHHVGVAVDAELAFDPLVDDWNITVVHLKGDVSLHGTVASYPEYVEAEAATRAPVLDARGSLRFPSAGSVRRQPRGKRCSLASTTRLDHGHARRAPIESVGG